MALYTSTLELVFCYIHQSRIAATVKLSALLLGAQSK